MIQLTDIRTRIHFGEALVQCGAISQEELNAALNLQRQSPDKIGKLLIDIGAISDTDMVKQLSDHLGIPYVAAADFPQVPPVENILSPKFMREACCLPIDVHEETTLLLAMSDPQDRSIRDAVRLYTEYQEVRVVLAAESEILDRIERFYGNESTGLGRIVEGIEDVDSLGGDPEDIEHLRDLASEAPVIRLVNLIISRAVEARGSDIHVEPFEKDLKIRYRIDGILYDFESPPKRLKAAIISRIKIMSKLNIAERRIPQDGRIKMKVLGRDIDLRVSTLPTMYGESVVMRILDKSNTQIYDLEKLGFSKAMFAQFSDLISQPHGILLVTGPTGSGKTTTLYGALNRINLPDKKIITIEDPVEYQINGINQIHVNPKIGLTFAIGLRSIVRQDPDVIMVGEMRDLETAQIGIRAALTGHLVFSTLHTNDAPSAIARLVDMGAEDYLLSSSVIGVLAQRLVRRICPQCKVKQDIQPEVLQETGCPTDNGAVVYQGQGCTACSQTGYLGRVGIFELMLMDEDIRRLTITNADSAALRQAAMANGMVALRQNGFEKVYQGLTTVSEVLRVTEHV